MGRPKNNGKKYEKQFVHILESTYKKRIFIERFKDTSDASGRAKKLVIVDAQPSDFLVTLNGLTAYVEVKDCNNKTSFPFSNITTSQIMAAKQQIAAKGLYFFVIHHKGQWHCVPASVILNTKTRKSLPWEDLKKYQLKQLKDITRYFIYDKP